MQYLQRPKEGYGFPGAGATSGCGLLNMGAGNRPLVLCGSSSQSQLLNHLSTVDIPQLFRRTKLYQLKENEHNHIKWIKSAPERQIPNDLSLLWFLGFRWMHKIICLLNNMKTEADDVSRGTEGTNLTGRGREREG